MGISRRVTTLLFTATLLGAPLALVAVPPLTIAADTCTNGITTIALPTALNGLEPHAVAAVNGQPAWISGLPLPRANPRVPMIGMWTGTGWTKVAAPWKSYGVINAIAATSSTNAWMVGATGIYTRWPLAGHWDGATWTNLAVPPERPMGGVHGRCRARRQSLLGRGRAAGHERDETRSHDLPPKGLAQFQSQAGGRHRGGLTSAAVDQSGRVWAAGWRSNASGQGRPWVGYRVTGNTWTTTTVAPIAGGRASILDIYFQSANDGWTVGFVETSHGYVPLLQHWNGAAWSNVDLSWAAGQSVILESVVADSSGHPVVAGMVVDLVRKDILASFDGLAWTVHSTSAGSATQMSDVMDLAPVSNGVVGVGFVEGNGETWLSCSDTSGPGGTKSATPGEPGTGAEIDDDTPPPSDSVDTFVEHTVSVANTVAVDVTSAAGLAISDLHAFSWGGVVGDFNGDGYDDIFSNRHYQAPPVLMLNSHNGVFSEADYDLATRDRHGCDAADVDQNGQLDLLCAIGVNKGTSNKPDELTLNLGNNGGTWASTALGLIDGYGRGRDVKFLNLGDDPYPDVYITNEPNRSDGLWSSNRLYQNVDGRGFESVPSWGVDKAIGYGCVNAADLNLDGHDELLVCTTEPTAASDEASATAQVTTTMPAGARIFYNEGDHFVDRTAQLGVLVGGVTEMLVADFNNDGLPDLAQLTANALRVSLQGANDTFTSAYQLSVTGGTSMAQGDVNGDGLPDIYLARRVAGNSGNLMLVNDGNGTSFSQMAIPEPNQGSADEVLAIDYDHNGRTDFLTINGWSKPGSDQLTAFSKPLTTSSPGRRRRRDLTGDVRGFIRGQETDGIGDLLRRAETAEGGSVGDL